MSRDLKIHVDPQDIRVPEEGDFTADDHVKEVITQALVLGETGGQAFGLLIAAMGTFAALSDQQITLLQVAIDCLSADLEEQKAQQVVTLLGQLPEHEPPPAWQEGVHAAADEIDKDKERNKP